MASLETTYMGLSLKNPIIVGSCGITKNLEGVLSCQEAGAGAVVLKSLFEEEIRAVFSGTEQSLEQMAGGHSEAYGYLEADLAAHYGADRYLTVVEQIADGVEIPVIASINCTRPGSWSSYARKLELAGAAALELNIFVLPTDPSATSESLESSYVIAAKAVVDEVRIPVAVKLVPYLTSPLRLALALQDAGVAGLVLFNRFFHPDIDLDKREFAGGLSLSSPDEFRLPLRWIAQLSGRVEASLCGSTGVHDGATALKMLFAGASAVQMTSALYIHKLGRITEALGFLEQWLDANSPGGIPEVVGQMGRGNQDGSSLLERAQYIKAFVGVE
jgi:dihydroorotate dehydrogenase (fumarate)